MSPVLSKFNFLKRRDVKKTMFSTNLWSPITLGPFVDLVIFHAFAYWNGQSVVRLFRTSCQGKDAGAEYEEKQCGQE